MHALQTFYLLTVKNDSESDGLVGNIVASRFVVLKAYSLYHVKT